MANLCNRLARLERGSQAVIHRPIGEPLNELLERMFAAWPGDPKAQFDTTPWLNAMTHEEVKEWRDCLTWCLTADQRPRDR